jgi:hypothetical protein
LPEHPIPEKMAALWGGIWSSARAIWIDARMPKSPQPGHQSLVSGVL